MKRFFFFFFALYRNANYIPVIFIRISLWTNDKDVNHTCECFEWMYWLRNNNDDDNKLS